MTWFAAACYALAIVLVLCAAASSRDPRLLRLIGESRQRRDRARFGTWTAPISRWSVRVWNRDRDERRLAEGIPDLLDVLATSVTAGLSPRLALDRAPQVISGPVGEVLTGIRRQVALGTSWAYALDHAASTLGVEELHRLALTLSRAERLGSPVAERLRDLAVEVRAERRARREEQARRAPIQMLFPLVFLILPAFVLAAVVPALLVATRDLI